MSTRRAPPTPTEKDFIRNELGDNELLNRIFINSNKEYSDINLFRNFTELFYNNHIILIIFFIFLIKYFYNWRKDNEILQDLLIFVIISYSILISPFIHHPSYLFKSDNN